MTPTFAPGDRLLVRYGATAGPGDAVVVRLVHDTLAVKRISHPHPTGSGLPGWYLVGDNADEGAYSLKRGAVPQDAVLAVVRARISPRPRWQRRRPPAPGV